MKTANPGGTLDFDVSAAPDAGSGTTVAVLLHGRGSDKADLQGLRPLLPRDWVLVTPQAPFPAAQWSYGRGGAWYRYLEEDRLDTETLGTSLDELDQFFAALPELLGLQPGRLVMGGFSQGGTVSLSYALTRPASVAAALVFSGFLPGSLQLDEGGSAPPTTPIFWGHGTRDRMIPIAIAAQGRTRLRSAGAKLRARDYPIGHWIVAEEVEDAVAMVDALG